MSIECQYCRRPEAGTCEVISRHTTTEGVVVYVRCACGQTQRYQVSNAEMRSWYQPMKDRAAAEPALSPAISAA